MTGRGEAAALIAPLAVRAWFGLAAQTGLAVGAWSLAGRGGVARMLPWLLCWGWGWRSVRPGCANQTRGRCMGSGRAWRRCRLRCSSGDGLAACVWRVGSSLAAQMRLAVGAWPLAGRGDGAVLPAVWVMGWRRVAAGRFSLAVQVGLKVGLPVMAVPFVIGLVAGVGAVLPWLPVFGRDSEALAGLCDLAAQAGPGTGGTSPDRAWAARRASAAPLVIDGPSFRWLWTTHRPLGEIVGARGYAGDRGPEARPRGNRKSCPTATPKSVP